MQQSHGVQQRSATGIGEPSTALLCIPAGEQQTDSTALHMHTVALARLPRFRSCTPSNTPSRCQTISAVAYRLTVPRRPPWSPDMTAEAVDAQQRASFLAWRRELAEMEDVEGLILTPFEKNLEVWAQLWRVLERSQAVVQVC